MGQLQGKRAVIIGAAGRDNMGQYIARRFAREGARLTLAGRDPEALAALADELGGHACRADITSEQDMARLAASATDAMGGVDIALNATGWGLLKPFDLTTVDELQRITALQFIGPFLFFQAMLRVMPQGGSLVQISSATATIMLENHAAYMGTKAGFDHVMRCLANEFGARGIRANSISPGYTTTPMTQGATAIPGILETYQSCY